MTFSDWFWLTVLVVPPALGPLSWYLAAGHSADGPCAGPDGPQGPGGPGGTERPRVPAPRGGSGALVRR
ncbi:hypothetical protein MO973_32455 [Paenibacillus sp. TRM 82003]|uniref:hypothetical protein n=1 Tax=Kineococcus sp. TRM81007 TaxID=2925831 RepID=UPI001F55DDAB|nr:hypothetical protein [Kineococcus sp. TRM81007]MCI2239248.1 hypothetical protein [Kineococcus sp. TRM81007]MCI3924930.1 hypothetical protein [Paenibacillus sp. TRM 82003]